MNGKAIFQLSFHAFAAVMYFCALVRYEYLPPMPHKREIEHFAGRLKYLTYWNLIVHFLYFAFSCVIDVMKSSSKYSKLTRARDNLYAGIVVPYGIFVVFMFWGIYSLDRELIFPTALDAIFPSWLNHVSHTVILPVLLIETYIIKHRQPSLLDALKYAAVFGLAYLLWVLFLALVMDIWIYPVLQNLDWPGRCVFIVMCIAWQAVLCYVGEKINYCIWGECIFHKIKSK